jgi:putative membrane protein
LITTASTAKNVPFRQNRFLQVLVVLFLAAFAASGINPVMVSDWWAENGMVILAVGALAATYRWLTLSQLSYLLLFIFLCMHEWGAHYRYGIDPLGEWMKQFQATQRNQFDRWTHFSFGLLAYYPQREILMRWGQVKAPWSFWLPVFLLLGYGAGYELIEAGAAMVLDPATAEAFLALQADPWDTHKDMLLAVTGAALAMAITLAVSRFTGRLSRRSRTQRTGSW